MSRLDRLFVLLESGSSTVTRRLAAKQLGEAQRLHPHELHSLLGRTVTLLRSGNWDTRIAATQAIEAIITQLPVWDPQGLACKSEREPVSSRLTLATFNIQKILSGAPLTGSEGKEYDIEEEGGDIKEKIQKQKQLLNARLGLGPAANVDGEILNNLFTNEDLIPVASTSTASNTNRKQIDEMLNGALSSREMNRARRKARQMMCKNGNSKTQLQSQISGVDDDEPEQKKIKIEIEEISSIGEGYGTPDATGNWPADVIDWPLEELCERLWIELFSTRWESRHGAATALREVLKVCGNGAGKHADYCSDEMEYQHQTWLEDAAVRLLWILALDRFGDFVSDQVVAPVRETVAQVLGLVIKDMSLNNVRQTLGVLIEMLGRQEWETRHGGLLGIKYMLAVRKDILHVLLPIVFPHIRMGLSDAVDDVGAVAASSLIPVASLLIKTFPVELVEPLVQQLWDLLLDQDELASACNSFMGLLAALLSLKESTLESYNANRTVVSRLWPFLSHNTSSVRRATLQTLRTLTNGPKNSLLWPHSLLQEALRHVFQRVLIEPEPDIQQIVEQVWSNLITNAPLDVLLHAACPWVASWLCLTMQPPRLPFDPTNLILAKTSPKKSRPNGIDQSDNTQQKFYLGGVETTPIAVREQNVTRARCMASRMLGELTTFLVKQAPGVEYPDGCDPPIVIYVRMILAYIQSNSALQRLVVGLVLGAWANKDPNCRPCHPSLGAALLQTLNESVYYDEIAVTFTRLLQDTKDFLAMLKHYKVQLEGDFEGVLNLEKISVISGTSTQQTLLRCKLKPKVAESLEERRRSINAAVNQTSSDHYMLSVSTLAAIAGSATRLQYLPVKLNPIIKPLMESIKREQNEILQQLSAENLAELLSLCVKRTPCPNSKVVGNLCILVKSDNEFTPKISSNSEEVSVNQRGEPCVSAQSIAQKNNSTYYGILTLDNYQKSAERAAFKRSTSTTGRGPGRPPATDIPIEELIPVEDEATQQAKTQRRGGTFALKAIVSHFAEDLPNAVPKLWEIMRGQLESTVNPSQFEFSIAYNNDAHAEELVSCLQVLEVTLSSLYTSLLPVLLDSILPRLSVLLGHPYKAVRHMAARVLAVASDIDTPKTMIEIVNKILPLLEAIQSDINRQGAAEAFACVVDKLQVNIIPYVVLLVVPLLGRMSDPDQSVRLMSTHTFARLIQLYPLDGESSDAPTLPKELYERRDRHRNFLRQLFRPNEIPDYKVPIPIQAELRSYQQSGINWLAFLNRYRLHGVLCDDMGLGKTLQSICILAGDHHARAMEYAKTKALDCAPLPSIVICPPTLTGHWVYEVNKFLANEYIKPLQYAGPPMEREKLRPKIKNYNLIVASYDIVRKDITFFSSLKYNYCILDEGHIIKNGKTKAAKAVKVLTANHRLILSGTPIQNNVLELWSLFDFLMPGFLGTERQFTAKYSRPILTSRDPKSSPREQEAGALAMEALHRQVLPFLLRRMKEDVLKDLPPKITQDYYCELSPLQERLYEDFSKSHLPQNLQDSGDSKGQTGHIFQALRYLQNVCNHPKLVLTPAHPEYPTVSKELQLQKTSLNDIQHSAKLPALKQLLLDCGIGNPVGNQNDLEICVNQHRALVFCQLKAMLDIIEKDLFLEHMPGLTYMRLDGSIPPVQRHSVVTKFNNDPSIDVLLLTTQVGGLGLNLTGADTVIFVEHDWNPQRDVQAMDRAHRIGQKRVVNVYRLITRSTLEERIMGLQKFKLQTANTVISSDNASLDTMDTSQLFDLFTLDKNKERKTNQENQAMSTKSVLISLPELWDDNQYEEQYDIDQYVAGLKKK